MSPCVLLAASRHPPKKDVVLQKAENVSSELPAHLDFLKITSGLPEPCSPSPAHKRISL